jgi:hypothetical protein
MTSKFLVGAAFLSAAVLFKSGAPIIPIAAGIAGPAVLQWRRQRRRAAGPSQGVR